MSQACWITTQQIVRGAWFDGTDRERTGVPNARPDVWASEERWPIGGPHRL